MLRAASDDVVPHSHTDQLVSKLAQLIADETVPGADHLTIPYLDDTQARIARFLTSQFARPLDTAAIPVPAAAIVVPVAATTAVAAVAVPAQAILPLAKP